MYCTITVIEFTVTGADLDTIVNVKGGFDQLGSAHAGRIR